MKEVRKMKIILFDIDESICNDLSQRYNSGVNLKAVVDQQSLFDYIEQYAGINICVVLDEDTEKNSKYIICAKLKALSIPVIFTTSTTTKENRLRLLSIGASLVIPKPYCCDEIIYTANVLIGEKQTTVISDKNFEIDLINHQVYFRQEKIELSPQEYAVILILVQNEGRVVSRNKIKNAVYDCTRTVNERHIDTLVKKIRNRTNYDLIKTCRGRGYLYNE